jgi:hypothetical protein
MRLGIAEILVLLALLAAIVIAVRWVVTTLARNR